MKCECGQFWENFRGQPAKPGSAAGERDVLAAEELAYVWHLRGRGGGGVGCFGLRRPLAMSTGHQGMHSEICCKHVEKVPGRRRQSCMRLQQIETKVRVGQPRRVRYKHSWKMLVKREKGPCLAPIVSALECSPIAARPNGGVNFQKRRRRYFRVAVDGSP